MSAMAEAGVGTGSSGGWGDWRLGDLADALAKAADVMGGSRTVSHATVFPPRYFESRPRVYVRVETRECAQEAAAWIIDGGRATSVEESPPEGSWDVEADGIALCILFDQGGDAS